MWRRRSVSSPDAGATAITAGQACPAAPMIERAGREIWGPKCLSFEAEGDFALQLTGRNGRHSADPIRRLVALACTVLATVVGLAAMTLPIPAMAGNSQTPGPGSFTDTTVADFSAGDTGPNTYIGQERDGEVILAPAVGEEFSGSSLPTGWSSADWNTGGSTTVANGNLTVDGARASTNATVGAGHSLDCVATFGAETFQHVGFSDNFASDNMWAIFSTYNTTNQIFARTNDGSSPIDTPITGSFIGSSHRYRIDWSPSHVTFFVDGNLVATHNVTFGAAMRPIASDFTTGAPDLSVDWVHLSPYATTGIFLSRVFDAGEPVGWDALSWHAVTPASTTLTLSVRTGDTSTPDASWSSFMPMASSGETIGGSSRYIQYQANLATNDANETSVLQDVRIDYSPPDPSANVPESSLAAGLLGAGAVAAGLVLIRFGRRRLLR
jgi:hypothetical protein